MCDGDIPNNKEDNKRYKICAEMLTLVVAIALVFSFISGCTMNSVRYQPDANITAVLKDEGALPLAVAHIVTLDARLNSLSVRGSRMISPYDDSYGEYLTQALVDQLAPANLYRPASEIQLRGERLENNLSAIASTGGAHITARFEILRNDKVVFNEVKSIEHHWESSLVGAIAIPAAQKNYPVAVKKLVLALMSDPDFLNAVRIVVVE